MVSSGQRRYRTVPNDINKLPGRKQIHIIYDTGKNVSLLIQNCPCHKRACYGSRRECNEWVEMFCRVLKTPPGSQAYNAAHFSQRAQHLNTDGARVGRLVLINISSEA